MLKHRYTQQGPFTRAHIVVFGPTPNEAVEEARRSRTVFANTLPVDFNCWPASYAGFDPRVGQHTAEFIVGFGTDRPDAPDHIDRLVATFDPA